MKRSKEKCLSEESQFAKVFLDRVTESSSVFWLNFVKLEWKSLQLDGLQFWGRRIIKDSTGWCNVVASNVNGSFRQISSWFICFYASVSTMWITRIRPFMTRWLDDGSSMCWTSNGEKEIENERYGLIIIMRWLIDVVTYFPFMPLFAMSTFEWSDEENTQKSVDEKKVSNVEKFSPTGFAKRKRKKTAHNCIGQSDFQGFSREHNFLVVLTHTALRPQNPPKKTYVALVAKICR